MNEFEVAFRSTFGLDASGEKVINVGYADRNVGSDGVNVDWFNVENTTQHYKEDRAYRQGFAVIYDDRTWYAKEDITKPSGKFNQLKWQSLRVDPKWTLINTTIPSGHVIKPGSFIELDTRYVPVKMVLPEVPQEGDTLTFKDVGGYVGNMETIITSTKHQFNYLGADSSSFQITKPYSTTILTYRANKWTVQVMDAGIQSRYLSANGTVEQEVQASQDVMRKTATGKIILVLPKYANQGDMIWTYDIDGLNPINHTLVKCAKGATYNIDGKYAEVESRSSGSGIFVFDKTNNTWRIWDGDDNIRLKMVTSNTQLYSFDYVMVTANSTATNDVVLTLPTDVSQGDTVSVSLRYLEKSQKCQIKVKDGSGDKIAASVDQINFPYRKDYPIGVVWPLVDSLDIDEAKDYSGFIELSYIEDGAKKGHWVISQSTPTIERVDPTNRERLGVAALAAQVEVNKNHEDNPNDETIITPRTLANKTATETRRGIARLATKAEVELVTTGAHKADIIVTPKTLNDRYATETRRGVAEIATQDETNVQGSTAPDNVIVTPRKLDARRATQTLAGIAPLVQSGGVAAGVRGNAGTKCYDIAEDTRVFTAKTLTDRKATETGSGIGYLATENEVIAGTANPAFGPILVTPVQLHKKTATTDRHGFTETATQVEVDTGTDNFRYVTPKTFNDRRSTEALTGIARYATAAEYVAGNADTIARPSVAKKHFDDANRFGVAQASGLRRSGTIWTTVSVDVAVPTQTQRGTARIATPEEVDLGTADDVIVSPKGLETKKATEGKDGIIRIANTAESIAGALDNVAVSPKNLKNVAAADSWKALETRQGFVKIAAKNATFVGTDLAGSTQAVDGYVHDGYSVTPRGLNFALVNYLPKMATAQNSLKLGNVLANNWMRRDIDQTHLGAITVNKDLTVVQDVNVTGDITGHVISATNQTNQAISVGVVDVVGDAGIVYQSKTGTTNNHWTTYATGTNQFVFASCDKTNSTVSARLTVDVNGDVYARRSLIAIEGNSIISSVTGKLYIGGTADSNVALSASSTETLVGNSSKTTVLHGQNDDAARLKFGSTSATIINTSNFKKHLDSTYINATGDTMTGMLVIKSGNYGTRFLGSGDSGHIQAGSFVDNDKNQKMVISGIAGSKLSSFNILCEGSPTAQAAYKNITINGNAIYHTGYKPTAQDIGAISGENSETNTMKIRDWIQVGNCKIMANNVTKTVEFIWMA